MKLLKPLTGICIFAFFIWASSTQFSGCTKKDTVTIHDTLFNLQDGLVAWYTFNGSSLADGSGFNNNIVFNNATPTADRFGNANNAFLFNGTSSYMRITNSPSLNPGAITLMAIVKFNGYYHGSCHGNDIIKKGITDQDNGTYGLRASDLKSHGNCSAPVDTTTEVQYGYFGAQSVSVSAFDTVEFIKPGKWMTVVFTYDGQTAKFYVDGVLKDSHSQVVAYSPNPNDLFIGSNSNPTYPYWFNGAIDEVRVYNRALSQLSIQQFQKLTN